jgi:alpha-mannosidase II
MAYLLKQMGFNGMLVQRVHYHLKKYMGQTKRFEFNWRQGWSSRESKETSIFTHVMPFYSYDIPHTCGPDPKVCCQFDFKRLSQLSCPWGVRPVVINDMNVEERASTLLDQYRKKAQLYGDESNHNVVLVPLGDDFRYSDIGEAQNQFENYERLMKYMNERKDWNVNVRFGTLREYFELAMKNNEKTDKKVETFSGDFFTYADRQDHYWSGYFTSRPFYKRLNRLVEYYLRSSEIIYSVVNLLQSKIDNSKLLSASGNLFQLLLTARRNLALFQHHDGITGTSKSHVVLDYAEK